MAKHATLVEELLAFEYSTVWQGSTLSLLFGQHLLLGPQASLLPFGKDMGSKISW